MSSSSEANQLPASLVSDLQSILSSRNPTNAGEENGANKPTILVTNGDGIGSPGLTFLVEALVREGQYDVNVCAPESDKSASAHSVTLCETLAVSSVDINGATAFEVSGTPADCVSLALSGALFSWSKPTLVVTGINKGISCGHNIFYSGAAAGAREALLSGVPSLSISLNWKNEVSQENDFQDAVHACLPLIHAAIRDSEKGSFPKSCFLSVEVPLYPSKNKGFKITRQSSWRPSLNWKSVTANKHPTAGQYMSMQQSLGIQLAQLSRDASAAGAARRLTTQRKNVEIIESVAADKPQIHETVKKYFRLEFMDNQVEDADEDLDFRAVENGFIAVTPAYLHTNVNSAFQASASDWLASIIEKLLETGGEQ